MAGMVTMIASYINIFLIASFPECYPTNKEGRITPIPIEAILAITPNVVTLGDIIGLNQLHAILDGELMIKILPAAARKDPMSTGAMW